MPDRLSPELPTVMWRLVAPSLPRAKWYEDEGALLEELFYVDHLPFDPADAVIHRLTLHPGNGYTWTVYAYQAPPGRGRLVPAATTSKR